MSFLLCEKIQNLSKFGKLTQNKYGTNSTFKTNLLKKAAFCGCERETNKKQQYKKEKYQN